MIPQSIKWRLQLWYGLILVAVLVGFGVTAYQLERGRQMRRLDDELHHRIGILGASLHHPPPGMEAGAPFLNHPRRDELPDFDHPHQDESPDQEPPFQDNRHLPPFHLPPETAHLFDATDPNGFFFRIESTFDHQVIARSTNEPAFAAAAMPSSVSRPETPPPPGPRPFKPQIIGQDYFTIEVRPSGEAILVGCSLAPELAELRKTALNLTAIGGLILLVGLAGGWWLVGRALKPISEISATAVKISAGDLSQRINAAETESELGQLAAVLNSTFARLDTAFAQQKQFAADAAHELRTPVSVILAQTQTALARDRDAAAYKQTVEACQRAAQRMRRLIESLLELARFDAGQEVLQRRTLNLAQTAADCLDLVQPLAAERRVKLLPDLQPVSVTGDATRLAQVVTNLLTNAIQFNRPDGEVHLRLATQDGLAVLEISDTGNGIAPADLPHVFERFYRADASRTGAGNSGLGLSICRAIVQAHGGTIDASSVEKSRAKFIVRLPLVA
jgi:heavy metal sensor kinase